MNKLYFVVLILVMTWGCAKKAEHNNKNDKNSDRVNSVVDSLLYARHHAEQTDILSRKFPDLSKEEAIAIQMEMINKEKQSGAHLIGWKMGGTITDDLATYNPVFGYLLESNLFPQDTTFLATDFPGDAINVEGEIGFIMGKDFTHGVSSMKELKEGISYVVNAVELAQFTAIQVDGVPDSINFNHNVAAGAGQVGIILGSGRASIQDFDLSGETVKCYINGKLVEEGISSNVYGGPLHALYSLANMLPKYGTYLKKGDIVITGSVYKPPTVGESAKIRVKSETLGTINFNIK